MSSRDQVFYIGTPKRKIPAVFSQTKDAADFTQSILGWQSHLVRTGQIIFWPTGLTAPDDTVAVSAFPISRTTYAALYSVYGTTFGVGDGSTTFDGPTITAPAGTTALVQV